MPLQNQDEITAPQVFISYSWEDEAHQTWVLEFATTLRTNGVDVTLDQWHAVPGDQLPAFMESAVRENDYVLIICTPRYKEKADSRSGGVGYEGDIMTAEVMTTSNHRKFIPILRKNLWNESSPSWLKGKYYIDLSGNPYSEEHYNDLLLTLYGRRRQAPPLGSVPAIITSQPHQVGGIVEGVEQFEPIRIIGVIADEVTLPRNDGTRGSGLYAIPFQLSRRPSTEWANAFLRTWEHPPQWTTMHRPSIARVSGDRIVLDGTTIEEVERYHRDTLKVVLDSVNQWSEAQAHLKRVKKEQEKQQQEAHEAKVRDAVNRLKFD